MRPLRFLAVPALLGAFLLLLLFVTLTSTPKPPPRGVGHTAEAAHDACWSAVRQEIPGGRAPFTPTVTYRGDARYHLRGYVDFPQDGEVVRRNYQCVVGYRAASGYRVDSLQVWQSH